MRQHDANGRQVAAYLAKHPKVSQVFYPGLETHPQHELAKRQMSGFGSMIAFESGSRANADKILRAVRVITNGESLGGVESLISHSATTTHAAVPAEERERIGITEGLVRISVGIEDIEDILEDLDQALKAAMKRLAWWFFPLCALCVLWGASSSHCGCSEPRAAAPYQYFRIGAKTDVHVHPPRRLRAHGRRH